MLEKVMEKVILVVEAVVGAATQAAAAQVGCKGVLVS
jgi:thiazole synthase ThiGH ThiG subunit